jgi:hypothetical protein
MQRFIGFLLSQSGTSILVKGFGGVLIGQEAMPFQLG